MIRITQNRIYSYIFSGLLMTVALVALFMWGLKWGIDFTGGSLLEVEFKDNRPTLEAMHKSVGELNLGSVNIQPLGDKGALLRLKDIDNETHTSLISKLTAAGGGEVTEKRFESIGPIIGVELRNRSLWAIALALFFVVTYISWAFRKVSHPVASWKYGVAAIIALAHDIITVTGVFAILGHFFGIEVDSMFVSALLTILGFSVHDTIVVFDRIRENLFRHVSNDFTTTVNKSVNDTLARSINTSLTTILVLSSLFVFGGETIRYFSLALLIGITIGTYSSIFVASPIVLDWHNLSLKKK